MDQQDQLICEICFFIYSEERILSQLNRCGHILCFECVKLCVIAKATCPFCKQNVEAILLPESIQLSLSELILRFPQQIDKESQEADLQLLDHCFFDEDINTLIKCLKDCYQRLMQKISQKDCEFDRKWKIYDKVEQEVGAVNKIVKEKIQMNPSELMNRINDLMAAIDDMRSNNWSSTRLDKFIEIILVFQDENFLDVTFFIKNKKQKRKNSKKQHKKIEHSNEQKVNETGNITQFRKNTC